MDKNAFEELEYFAVEEINGGSVADGVTVWATTGAACVSILGSASSMLLGVGVIAACAPAAIVVAVTGTAIGGLMIGQGLANGDIV